MTLPAGPLLIDAHVHIHRSFQLSKFFSAAASNFQHVARSQGLSPSTPGCLMLAEMPGEDAFSRVQNWLEEGGGGEWKLMPTDELTSLSARATDGGRLILLAGRQVVTGEKLEVLGLGVDQDLPFGLALEDTIRVVDDAGAIPVLPWGFGKWWFGRGKRVLELFAQRSLPRFFLGDNSGRPRGSRTPRQFNRAAERGVAVLPGTDPLPLPAQWSAVGSFGFMLDWEPRASAPGKVILEAIRTLDAQPPVCGSRKTLPAVIRDQAALRIASTRP